MPGVIDSTVCRSFHSGHSRADRVRQLWVASGHKAQHGERRLWMAYGPSRPVSHGAAM